MFVCNNSPYGYTVNGYNFPSKRAINISDDVIKTLESNPLFNQMRAKGNLTLSATCPSSFKTQGEQLSEALRQIEALKSSNNSAALEKENAELKKQILALQKAASAAKN